ncbi:MFS general substrate transporter [Dentipellis sp. KUC8613]|nr:MFS general substrate transporter [Dentipellis sp. KUC8613]
MQGEQSRLEAAQAVADSEVKDDPEKATAEEVSGNPEGTHHQLALGDGRSRRWFFSALRAEYADAVHRDAAEVEYTEKEEKRVRRKIDNRVLTLVIASYIFNQFDRTNIGNAHVIKAFNDNYGITNNNRWTLALSIFYVGYCLLEMPANVLQRYIGANRFFFLSLSFWGLASLSFVYAKGFPALLILRVLLGIGEAGYYAGMIYYLSFWYKRRELATRISLCMTGTLPGAIGGLVAFGLVRAHTSVLKGWQFLFLIEAIPDLVMAFMILFFLPSFPFSATFLTPREKAIAQARLNRDHKPRSHGGMNGWQGFKAVVSDVNSWLLVTIYASFNVGVATSTYFLPTLIKDLGFSSINAQGLTVAPYLVGWFMVVFQAWHSDRTQDRGFHIMASASTSFLGYLILATTVQKSVGAAYFGLFLVIGGNFSLFPLVMSWAANVFSPTSKRGVGTAFIVSISNCVSIASPQIYFDPEDNYRKGHAISAGCLFASILAAFILRTRLSMKNKSNAAKLARMEEEGKVLADIGVEEEIRDDDPRYVFMT